MYSTNNQAKIIHRSFICGERKANHLLSPATKLPSILLLMSLKPTAEAPTNLPFIYS